MEGRFPPATHVRPLCPVGIGPTPSQRKTSSKRRRFGLGFCPQGAVGYQESLAEIMLILVLLTLNKLPKRRWALQQPAEAN